MPFWPFFFSKSKENKKKSVKKKKKKNLTEWKCTDLWEVASFRCKVFQSATCSLNRKSDPSVLTTEGTPSQLRTIFLPIGSRSRYKLGIWLPKANFANNNQLSSSLKKLVTSQRYVHFHFHFHFHVRVPGLCSSPTPTTARD